MISVGESSLGAKLAPLSHRFRDLVCDVQEPAKPPRTPLAKNAFSGTRGAALSGQGRCRGVPGTTVAARTDSAILHEIVRIIQERDKVPEKVRIRAKQYQITYLDDHRQRLEEAMRRHDKDRLGMLFGQLPGKIKYQLLKAGAKRTKPPKRRAAARR